MDYIIKKLDNYIEISENSIEKQTLMRERIEYILYMLLGYLWSAKSQNIDMDSYIEIVKSMDKMSIGELVGAVRKLDMENE